MKRIQSRAVSLPVLLLFLWPVCPAAIGQTSESVSQADELFRVGRFADAEGAYAKALEADPQSFQATLRMGEIALLGNRHVEAEKQLRRAMVLRPDEQRPKELLAETLYRQDRFEEAADLRRGIGPGPVADKLGSFKGLTPYDTPGDASVTEVPFVRTDPLPIVRARINGGDEVYLLIDTGAAELYLDPDFAATAGVERFGDTTGTYAGGKQAPTGHGRIESLQLGDFKINNIPVLLLPTRRLPVRPPDGQIDGVLGTAVFYHFFVTLDYPAGKLILWRKSDKARTALESLANAPGTHVIPFWMAGSHFMVAWGRINESAPCLLFADTGLAGGGLVLQESVIKDAGIDLAGLPSFEGMGGGGPVKVTPFTVKRVSFGGAVETGITGMAGAIPPNTEYQHGFRTGGIISHGFFRSYALTFDFEKMRFLLHGKP